MSKNPSPAAIFASWFLAACFAICVAAFFSQTVHCQERKPGNIEWHGPKQSPAELADVLRACECPLTNVARMPAPLPEGPTVVIIGSRPGAASWLDFPAPSPRIRLDGTPIWLPPTVYGSPFRYPMRHFGTFPRSEWVPKGGDWRQESDHLHQARRWQ